MKTLIIYSTKHGCVAKVAEMIQAKLTGEVRIVNIKHDALPNLNEYDRVILGGSIYIGKTQPELLRFISSHLSTLLKKPLGLYLCAGENDPAARQKLLDVTFPELVNHAVAKEVVGGEFTISTMNFLEKMMVRMVAGKLENSSTLSKDVIERLAQTMNC